MKRISIWIFILAALILACSTRPVQKTLPGGQAEYHFFKILSEKIPVLDPDKSVVLTKSSQFELKASDIFPAVYQEYGFFGDPPEKIKKGELISFFKSQTNRLSNRLLLAAAARDRGFSVPTDSVQKNVADLFAHFGGREAAIRDLAKQGMTLNRYKKNYIDRQLYHLYMKNYVQKVVYKNLTVSEKEIRDFYNGWATANFQLLTLSFAGKTGAQKDSLHKKMEEIVQKARTGADFSKLVKTYSDLDYKKEVGGLFENFPRTELPPDIAKAIEKTPEGAVCDPLERKDDEEFMIVKVLKKMKSTQSFEKARGAIKNYLLWTKKRTAYKALVDSLKKKYHYQELVTF